MSVNGKLARVFEKFGEVLAVVCFAAKTHLLAIASLPICLVVSASDMPIVEAYLHP